jgi:hypothetical protein
MATITQDPVESAVKAPAASWKLRKVGPLTCRFADVADDVRAHPIPTVQSLAQVAFRLLGSHADTVSSDPKDVRRKALLAPKATRAAAEGAVRTEHLKDAKGVLHTKAAYAPLVTAVRKQLVTDLRGTFKAQDAAERETARQAAKTEKANRAASAKAIAAATKAAKFAVLPEDARPSKATSKDRTRPALTGAKLCQDPDGGWQLVATDSYQVCLFPLKVYGDAGLQECWLDAEALKAIEKSGAFRIKAGMLEPLIYSSRVMQVRGAGTTTVSVSVPDARPAASTKYQIDTKMHFPRVRDDGRKGRTRKGEQPALMLRPEPAPSKRMQITFNAHLLAQMCEAIGSKKYGVTIVFDLDCFTKAEDGHREWTTKGDTTSSPTIRIQHGDVRGHLMPVRRP